MGQWRVQMSNEHENLPQVSRPDVVSKADDIVVTPFTFIERDLYCRSKNRLGKPCQNFRRDSSGSVGS